MGLKPAQAWVDTANDAAPFVPPATSEVPHAMEALVDEPVPTGNFDGPISPRADHGAHIHDTRILYEWASTRQPIHAFHARDNIPTPYSSAARRDTEKPGSSPAHKHGMGHLDELSLEAAAISPSLMLQQLPQPKMLSAAAMPAAGKPSGGHRQGNSYAFHHHRPYGQVAASVW